MNDNQLDKMAEDTIEKIVTMIRNTSLILDTNTEKSAFWFCVIVNLLGTYVCGFETPNNKGRILLLEAIIKELRKKIIEAIETNKDVN